jgi:hypothetical protein
MLYLRKEIVNMKKNTFRRIISICVIVFLFGSLLLPAASASFEPPTENIPFEDVPRGRWDHGYVSWAWVNNITTGTSQTSFSPNNRVTRGEFVTFLYRIAGEPSVAGYTPHSFIDVPAGRFFSIPVLWAVNNEVTTGTSSRTFAPNSFITREQLAAMLYRYIYRDVEEKPTFDEGVISDYLDRNAISTWQDAREAVKWAVYHEVMGVNTNFRLNPRSNTTRSEAMAMIKRVMDIYGEGFDKPWTLPFLTVDPLEPRIFELPPMDEIVSISRRLTIGMPLVHGEFEISAAGTHRIVLTGLEQVGGQVQFRVLRWAGGDFVELTDFIPLGFREGHVLELSTGFYRVLIERYEGSLGDFTLSVLRQKPTTTISNNPDYPEENIREETNIIRISDYMEFESQHNDYRFQTPTSTGTGLQVPGGMYRFGVTAVPSEVGIRSTIRLEVFLERGMVRVVGPIDLALLEGVNGELRDNETYIIRTTQIPIAGSTSGTVMSRDTPYTLQVSTQKKVTEIAPLWADANSTPRQSRISVVNDSFQFIGQMNAYEFTAPSDGTFQFRPNRMPGTSRSVFRISDPWGDIHTQTIGIRESMSRPLRASVTYRMHIIHQPGNPLGAYSFTIIYP